MEKLIKRVKEDIVQITTVDERWYIKTIDIHNDAGDKIGEEYKTVPSITWIASYYPKGVAFYKWLANHSWDETQSIKESAGNKGSRVHLAIADLIDGKEVLMDTKYPDRSGNEAELTAEEYYCVMTFVDWFKEVKPVVHASEEILFGDEYAGTLDLYCTIRRLVSKEVKATKTKEGKEAVYADDKWIVDFKTGASIWPEHHIQLTGYSELKIKTFPVVYEDTSEWPKLNLGILQIGYKKNRKGFKFTQIPYVPESFDATQQIWKVETAGIEPKQRDYPVKLTLKEEENE